MLIGWTVTLLATLMEHAFHREHKAILSCHQSLFIICISSHFSQGAEQTKCQEPCLSDYNIKSKFLKLFRSVWTWKTYMENCCKGCTADWCATVTVACTWSTSDTADDVELPSLLLERLGYKIFVVFMAVLIHSSEVILYHGLCMLLNFRMDCLLALL